MATRLDLAVCPAPFAPLAELAHWHDRLSSLTDGTPAAESHFIGRVRGSDGSGEELEALELEHYPGMTEVQIQRLAAEAAAHHGTRAVLVRHRVGRLLPGETIVLVAVAADRRGPAQRCCQELLEALKHEAPFWKKEWRTDGRGSWVQGNTPLQGDR
jgi:molybdopterin synthase catalytic subunit